MKAVGDVNPQTQMAQGLKLFPFVTSGDILAVTMKWDSNPSIKTTGLTTSSCASIDNKANVEAGADLTIGHWCSGQRGPWSKTS
jgi:hypothetical protein